jgi:glucokinase-like ROK family protein
MWGEVPLKSEVVLSPDEASILTVLRNSHGMSKSDLARRTGMGRTALEVRLTTLRSLNLVEKGEIGESNGGRRPGLVVFQKTSGHWISIDLGQQRLNVGITNLNAEVITRMSHPISVADGPDAVLSRISELLDELLSRAHVSRQSIRGIGIGIPGPVDPLSGRPLQPPVMPGWHNYPVREYFETRYGLPTLLDNDVNAMTIGERWAGLGRNTENFIYVSTGPGIACGIICNGRIYRGADGCAGEIGHVPTTPDGPLCLCGKSGCLEAVAGAAALSRVAEEIARAGESSVLAEILTEHGSLTAEDLGTAVGRGDAAAIELVRRAGTVIGEHLAWLVYFFNPRLIVLGGGVADLSAVVLATVRETVYRHSLPSATHHITIGRSVLGENAGLIGVAAMQSIERLGLLPDGASVLREEKGGTTLPALQGSD